MRRSYIQLRRTRGSIPLETGNDSKSEVRDVYEIKKETMEDLLEKGFKAEDISTFYAIYNLTHFDINLAVLDPEFTERADLLRRIVDVHKEYTGVTLFDWIRSGTVMLPKELQEEYNQVSQFFPLYHTYLREAIMNMQTNPEKTEECLGKMEVIVRMVSNFVSEYEKLALGANKSKRKVYYS